jgi:septal ring factor EnvC (AmiA/AmiB activator)
MPDYVNRHPRLLLAAICTIVACSALAVAATATGASVGQLSQQLNQTQANASSLSTDLSSIDTQVSKLSGQISLVQGRQHAAQQTLSADNAALAKSRAELSKEQGILKREEARLALSRKFLATQLRTQYENPQQSLVSVVLESKGFSQLLSQLQYLHNAQDQQRAIIVATRKAKDATETAERRIANLESADATAAAHARTQTQALAGMRQLLSSRQAALTHARAAKAAALQATKEHGAVLAGEISHIKAQEAAEARAAQLAAENTPTTSTTSDGGSTDSSSGTTSPPASSGAGSGAYDGWAIPYAIVLCESGGQNLPPNSAGASGYYQIIPSTWKGEGGTGPAAYLASRAEQSAVAARLWDGGAGASNWVCASIVGIH